MKKWLFNPFIYIAGYKSLILGWLLMVVTAVLAFLSKTHFDGVVDAHVGAVLPFWISLLEPLVDWACTVISFLGIGFFLSKTNIRYVDVFGTMALARWPYIFVALISFFINVPPHNNTDPASMITTSLIVVALISLLFTVWMVALMYNAFTVSCNLKGLKAVLGFIAGLILSELLSKLIFSLLHVYNK
jgi:hypothetical protein